MLGKHAVCSLLVSLLFSSMALANPKVGEAAPKDLGGATWIAHAPENDRLNELQGEVVYVLFWRSNNPKCWEHIPHLNDLHAKYGAKGFNLFAMEKAAPSLPVLKAVIKLRGITYPVSMAGGSSFSGNAPNGWLIGVEGKILWTGNPMDDKEKVDTLIAAEMAKVKYPGLGRVDVDKKVASLASQFSGKKWGEARDGAAKILDKAGVTEDAVSSAEPGASTVKGKPDPKTGESADVELNDMLRDAAYIIARARTFYGRLRDTARKLGEDKDYTDAMAVYETIIARFGKKSPEGTTAGDVLSKWAKDKDVQKEIKALNELKGIIAGVQKIKDDDKRDDTLKKQLADFIGKNEGTRAAVKAKEAMPG
jgi:thiol-disulfide isomerase/thioredoxin